MKRIVFLILSITLIFQACQTINNDNICNLWHYSNQLGDYSEILFGKNKVVLMMDETSKQVKIYNYELSDETISFTPIGSKEVEFWTNITYSSEDVIHIESRAEDEFILHKINGYTALDLDTSKSAILENFSSFKLRNRPE